MKKRSLAAATALLLIIGCLPAAAADVPALIRLHVIAASDSPADQAEKLAARDAVLAEAEELLAGCDGYTQAYRMLDERLSDVEAAAREALPGREVRASLTRERYPEREYGGLVVPEGEYDSLKVVIGAGEGRNWWCVVYPSLCALSLQEPEAVPASAEVFAPEEQAAQSFWGWLASLFAGEGRSHA